MTCRWCARSSHRVMVLYLGRVVELADRDAIYRRSAPSLHPRVALGGAGARSAKSSARKRAALPSDLPSPLDPRAPLTFLKSKLIDDPDAEQYRPQLIEVAPGHLVAEHDAY